MNFPETYQGPSIKDLAFCIPLKSGGSKWQDNELRYCLRSIEKFWNNGECPTIHLLTLSAPLWANLDKINVIPCKSYSDAVQAACGSFNHYIFGNDDILLLKPTNLNDLLTIRYMKEMIPYTEIKGNKWIKKLCKARDDIADLGYSPVFNFSTHTPYIFNGDLMKYVISKFGIENKTPLETYYYNIARDWYPAKRCDDKLMLNNGKTLPKDMSPYRFLNVFDKGLTDDVKSWLSETFSKKSVYEL